MWYVHKVVQPPPQSNSRAFSWPQKETHLVPVSRHCPSPPPGAGTVSAARPVLDISQTWDHTLCGLLCLASLTGHHVLKMHPHPRGLVWASLLSVVESCSEVPVGTGAAPTCRRRRWTLTCWFWPHERVWAGVFVSPGCAWSEGTVRRSWGCSIWGASGLPAGLDGVSHLVLAGPGKWCLAGAGRLRFPVRGLEACPVPVLCPFSAGLSVSLSLSFFLEAGSGSVTQASAVVGPQLTAVSTSWTQAILPPASPSCLPPPP